MISPKTRGNIVNAAQYLSSIVGTMLGEDVVDLWVLDGAEHQRLPVVFGTVVQVPHPHSRKVHSMGVEWLQVHVLHHILQGSGDHVIL